MRTSVRIKAVALLVLACVAIGIWAAAIREGHRGLLTVSFLKVGQGDAVNIEAPSGRQVLIDGGPDPSVLRQLSAVMPWWDRSIDVVLATDVSTAHITGLTDILGRYRVSSVAQSNVQSASQASNAFGLALQEQLKRGATLKILQRGNVIDLGKGAYLQILFPDRADPAIDPSDGSIVARLVYGKTSFLFTANAPQGVELYLAALDGTTLHSDVLQVGRNGAKTSSAPLFVGYVSPQYAVYSRGCNKPPDQETIATFARSEIPTLDTCESGALTFVSDGQTVARK